MTDPASLLESDEDQLAFFAAALISDDPADLEDVLALVARARGLTLDAPAPRMSHGLHSFPSALAPPPAAPHASDPPTPSRSRPRAAERARARMESRRAARRARRGRPPK
ncbi:hypothetical protein [Sphingomonas morindae]|uniref:Uncharacterized protein n=1 Tax=Sphingomonas morindae TaxID=1541170 RepID=A0ABY4X6V9_9SPHN|nr:hypothetical protein [Sphingomonas morindae]USI72640.1 hypothetical protein LHA26_15360 [Sphingomonas morindae]